MAQRNLIILAHEHRDVNKTFTFVKKDSSMTHAATADAVLQRYVGESKAGLVNPHIVQVQLFWCIGNTMWWRNKQDRFPSWNRFSDRQANTAYSDTYLFSAIFFGWFCVVTKNLSSKNTDPVCGLLAWLIFYNSKNSHSRSDSFQTTKGAHRMEGLLKSIYLHLSINLRLMLLTQKRTGFGTVLVWAKFLNMRANSRLQSHTIRQPGWNIFLKQYIF